MPPMRWLLSDEMVMTLGGTLGALLGAAGCFGLALIPVLLGAANDLPPPRDAPGLVAAGAAVIGAGVGTGVGIYLGHRYTKRRKEQITPRQ